MAHRGGRQVYGLRVTRLRGADTEGVFQHSVGNDRVRHGLAERGDPGCGLVVVPRGAVNGLGQAPEGEAGETDDEQPEGDFTEPVTAEDVQRPGPVGLLTGKKAYIFAARGGLYAGTALDTQTNYVRDFLRFVGIEDVEFVYAEGLAISPQSKASGLAAAATAIERLAA